MPITAVPQEPKCSIITVLMQVERLPKFSKGAWLIFSSGNIPDVAGQVCEDKFMVKTKKESGLSRLFLYKPEEGHPFLRFL